MAKNKKAEEHPINVVTRYVAIGLMVLSVALLGVAGFKSYLQKNPIQAQQLLGSLPEDISGYIQENWDVDPGYDSDYAEYEEPVVVSPAEEISATDVPNPTPDKEALAEMAVGTFESRLPSGREATEAEIFTIKTVFPVYLDEGLSPTQAYEQTEVFITSVWEASATGGRSASRDKDLENVVQQALDFSDGRPDMYALDASLRAYSDLQEVTKATATPNMTYLPTPKATIAPKKVTSNKPTVRLACVIRGTQWTEVTAVIPGSAGGICGYSPNTSKWANAYWTVLNTETRTSKLGVLFLSNQNPKKGKQSLAVTPTPNFSYFLDQDGCGSEYGCTQAP